MAKITGLRLAVAAGAVGALAACGTTGPTESPVSLSSTAPSASQQAADCPEAPLSDLDGTPVNLTGVWSFNGIWVVTQTGACVAIEGMSDAPGEENGSRWRVIYSGTMYGDRTIVGRWTWTYTRDAPRSGAYQQTLFVSFNEDGEPVLGSPATLFAPDVYGNPAPGVWTRISSDTEIPAD